VLTEAVIATVPRIPYRTPMRAVYRSHRKRASHSRLTLVAWLGSPLPALPLGSPRAAGFAWLPGHEWLTQLRALSRCDCNASFGRLADLRRIDLPDSKRGLSSPGFRSKVFGLGLLLLPRETSASVSDQLHGFQAPSGFGSGAATLAFTFTFGGGGGVQAWRQSDFRTGLHKKKTKTPWDT